MLYQIHEHRSWAAGLMFLVWICISANASATTWNTVTKTCPIDGTKVEGTIPGSTFIPGVTPDFRPKGVGVDTFLMGMLQCPTCGFTTSAGRYDEPDGLDPQKVKHALEALDAPQLFAKYDTAIVVEQNWTDRKSALARLTLGAKWLADDTGEPELIRERLDQAIAMHRKLLEAPDLPDEDRPEITYLLGELLRQRGDLRQAQRWFAKARAIAEGHLVPMIDRQAFLAEHAHSKPAQILAALDGATDGQKLAAIGLLRERDGLRAIAILERLCLESSPVVRETAMNELIGSDPRPVHLPIFLKALGNDHFRTVQGGAYAVQVLKAREAAPLIVEALKNPIESTGYRLLAALATTATENELGFLKTQVERDMQYDRILIALLNTQSPRAIPLIKQCADARPASVAYMDTEPADMEILKAFGPALGESLPDLREAPADSGQALLKVQALSVAQDPASADELAAAVARDNTLSFHAALALARRGDPRGKDYLVKHIDQLQSRDSVSVALLYPLLDEDDFTSLQAGLQREIDSRAEHIHDLQKSVDEAVNDELRAMFEKNLERAKQSGDWYVEQWLPLLGATGSRKAIPILTEYLENPDHQARAGAIRGLAYFNDDEIAGVLAERLLDENPHNQNEIVKALGRLTSPVADKALLKLIEQPTLVATKLAWIEASSALPDKQTGPVLERWADSPDATLAEAAREATKAE